MGLAAGAAIGAVGAIGSAVIGSSAASHAADAQTQAANTAAQTQLTMYNQTRSDLGGFMSGGNNAFSQLAQIFGFGGSPSQGPTQSYGLPGATQYNQSPAGNFDLGGGGGGSPLGGNNLNWDGYLQSNPDVLNDFYNGHVDKGQFPTPEAYAAWHYQHYGIGEGRTAPSPLQTVNTAAPGQPGNQPNAAFATDQLTKFPGYQFGFDQGTQALDRSAASRGLLLSGGQLKDAQTFGQGYAMQQAWQPYISELNSAAGLGENAAAGVGNAGTAAGQGIAGSQLAAGQSQAAGSIASGNQWGSALSQLSTIGRGLIPGNSSPLIGSYGSVTPGSDLGNAADSAFNIAANSF